jgi:hypothetical protein
MAAVGEGVLPGRGGSDCALRRFYGSLFLYLTGKESYPSGANYGGDNVCPLPGEAETRFCFLETPYMATCHTSFPDSLLAEGRNPQRRMSEGDFLSSVLIRASSSELSSPAQPGSKSSSS